MLSFEIAASYLLQHWPLRKRHVRRRPRREYRSVVHEIEDLGADFSVFVYGATGRFKTALASLLQQHFGADFAAHRLPGSWASTANFNARLAFIAKDAVLVIDDFRPGAAERRRLEGEADRLLRAAANGAGRGRLKSDNSLRPAHPPRALILSTGEGKPSGESLIARMFLVEVAPGDIDPKWLSACQRDAAGGLYAEATAAYIAWLAPRLDQVRAEMSAAHSKYREQAAHAGLHRRTPGIVADLFIGWERFLDFAHEAEALTRSEAEVYRARVWSALIEVARRQSEHQREANPVDRFLGLLRSAISTGHAHLATRDGGVPDNPGCRGWRTQRTRNHRRTEWLPQGARVGWLDGQDLFLDIDSAYRAAQAMAADGDGIAVGVQTLVKRLHESGRLKSIDERREKLKVRRMIDGSRLEILHLPADVLEHSVAEKTGPIGPSTAAKNDLPGSHGMGGFALVNGVP